MKVAILKHATEGKIYQTRRSPSDPLIPVRVNTEKHIWIWDTLCRLGGGIETLGGLAWMRTVQVTGFTPAVGVGPPW